jgi:LysR family transcriptional activator of nhaA
MGLLNYHHLRYFWTVAREGSIVRACRQLHLTQPTISGQLRAFERSLGVKLFARAGRSLVLTETGRTVFRFADEIFSLGRELEHTLAGRPGSQSLRLFVGVADSLPKEIAYRLLDPALRLPEPVQVTCEHGDPDYLGSRLAVNALDVVLSDTPLSPTSKIRAFNHLLGESGLSFMAAPRLVRVYRRGFPQSLNGAPLLMPAENTFFRRSLEQWFDAVGIRPHTRGEFTDPGLLKVFGQNGVGIFPVRTVVENETERQYGAKVIGRVPHIRERFYAISVERRLKHPAVVAITAAARRRLFPSG